MPYQASTISAIDFKTMLQQDPKAMVVDVRTSAEVHNEYLEVCSYLPLQELHSSPFSELLNNQACNHDQAVYLLCGSGMRAQKAVEQLAGSIPNPLVIVEGGIKALKQAGVAVKQGSRSIISLERQVRIAAGSLVFLGVVLGSWLNPAFYGLSAFVGAGLVFAGVTDSCGMAMALARMPWNRG